MERQRKFDVKQFIVRSFLDDNVLDTHYDPHNSPVRGERNDIVESGHVQRQSYEISLSTGSRVSRAFSADVRFN